MGHDPKERLGNTDLEVDFWISEKNYIYVSYTYSYHRSCESDVFSSCGENIPLVP